MTRELARELVVSLVFIASATLLVGGVAVVAVEVVRAIVRAA